MASEEVGNWGELLYALFDAFEATGKPSLPSGREDEVGRLMDRVMTDPNLFTEYLRALAAERDRRGLKRRLLALETVDIPDAQIIASGFVGLDTRALAEIAISPEALKALEQALYEVDVEDMPEFGEWFLREPDGTNILDVFMRSS